jgi:protein-tyrosine-phosphatase
LPHESGKRMKTYLFACVHNAGRSQMTAALFNLDADQSGCLAISAGTEPVDHVHPEVVELVEVQLLDVVLLPLVAVDRFRMDGGERG